MYFKIDEFDHVILVCMDETGSRVTFDLTAHIDARIAAALPDLHNPQPITAR